MPLLKYYINRLVGLIQNILLMHFRTIFVSGILKQIVEICSFQRFSNDFVFDQEMTISSISYGFRIGEIASDQIS